MADLEMKSCDFEKDANAEILFDVSTSTVRHIRIKIFNDFGKNQANVRIIFLSGFSPSAYSIGLQAETINLEDGKIVTTQLDRKLAYPEKIDRTHSALVFALPNVKAGSVIEYKYSDGTPSTWYFQSSLPTRYSEVSTNFSAQNQFRYIPHVDQPFVKNVGENTDYEQVKALANIHSLPNEPYMSSRWDNLQRMEYINQASLINTWDKIGEILLKFDDFGGEFSRSITGEGEIVKQAKSLKSDDDKIAFIFDMVKNSMKWNEVTRFYTSDGTVRAWDKKTGNSAEINLIVYNLLKKTGIQAYPLVISTKNNGKLNPANPNAFLLNNTVVYIPVDSTKSYVLDATNKYNLFNEVPANELNTFGLSIDENNKEYKIVFLDNEEPAMQSVFLNAEILPGGKMGGTVDITSYGYNKVNALQKYNTDGEKKYIDSLRNNDNSIKVSSIKMENMQVDSLPLTQKVDFTMELSGSDENYIYFNTNLFTLMGVNPFVNETRFSDIDFGYRDNYSINSIYKLPAGYKTDALPKTITIIMPDKSIIFKRTVAEENGTILVRYSLNHLKTIYFKKDYQDIRGFYKKMYELLNEQIVLKKS